MLQPEYRFFASCGDLYPQGPSTWNIVDWDQRRTIAVKMDGVIEDSEIAIDHLRRHIDQLAPEAVEIYVSPEGDLLAVSCEPKDDATRCPYYPAVAEVVRSGDIHVVARSELEEIDRLGNMVDLVRDRKALEPARDVGKALLMSKSVRLTQKQLVFKYYTILQRNIYVWCEMNLWMRLPKHPNIVPFDRVVIDEAFGCCVGFTSVFVPGGTLDESTNRTFKLKWLEQLITVVDELNFKYGIAHQDIAPRNLVVDPEKDDLMIFDFNFSARIGVPGYWEARNDVKGVVFTIYEIITRDTSLRSMEHESQSLESIDGQDWKLHPDVSLDQPVAAFRDTLTRWRNARARLPASFKECPEYIDWPDLPMPPEPPKTITLANGEIVKFYEHWDIARSTLQEEGKAILAWQRPAQSKLEPGDRLLATGEYLARDGDVGPIKAGEDSSAAHISALL